MSTTPKHPIKAAGSKAAQRALCMRLLAIHPRHTYELRKLGISHPAARILELIEQGQPITSSRVTTVDGDGFLHRGVALYSLADGASDTPSPKELAPDAGSAEAEWSTKKQDTDFGAQDLFEQCQTGGAE